MQGRVHGPGKLRCGAHTRLGQLRQACGGVWWYTSRRTAACTWPPTACLAPRVGGTHAHATHSSQSLHPCHSALQSPRHYRLRRAAPRPTARPPHADPSSVRSPTPMLHSSPATTKSTQNTSTANTPMPHQTPLRYHSRAHTATDDPATAEQSEKVEPLTVHSMTAPTPYTYKYMAPPS